MKLNPLFICRPEIDEKEVNNQNPVDPEDEEEDFVAAKIELLKIGWMMVQTTFEHHVKTQVKTGSYFIKNKFISRPMMSVQVYF